MENLNANPHNIDPEDGRPGRMVEDQFKSFLETYVNSSPLIDRLAVVNASTSSCGYRGVFIVSVST